MTSSSATSYTSIEHRQARVPSAYAEWRKNEFKLNEFNWTWGHRIKKSKPNEISNERGQIHRQD